jgi:oligopeptide transport system substrate-binding protein
MQARVTIRTLTLAIATFLAAAACASSSNTPGAAMAPADKQILRIVSNTEPNSYDPTQETYSYEAAVGRQVFEPLLKAKPDNSDVEPLAASGYSVSADGLTYTFHLRQNAKWSDGKPVTASDWIYGFKHFLNPALAAGYVDPFFDFTIKGGAGYDNIDVTNAGQIDSFLSGLALAAPDANTFVITLAQPSPYFKWVVSLWVAIPLRHDIVEQAAGGPFTSTDTTKPEMWANNPQTIVGNGPFKISEIVSKDHATLVPNAYYWNGAPHIQQLTYYFIADGNVAFSKYQTGAMDIINVPIADVTVVRGDPVLSKQAHLYAELSTFWMTFNTKRKPFDNPDVRMAFAKSIDRNALANDIEHGTDKPIASFFPKGMNGYDTSDNAQSFDPAAAKQLLQKAGAGADQLNKVKLLTRNTSGNKTVNQFIINQWNTNLGLNMQLDVIDSKTLTRDIRRGQFDIYGPDGWGADYPDQQDWADLFVSGACHSLNWGCPTLPGYDDLVKKADGELNNQQRQHEYLQLQKMLIDTAAVAFMYQQYEYDLISPKVSYTWTALDDEYTPGDQNYGSAYITT